MLVLYDRVIVFLLYNIRIASVLLLYVFVLVIQVVLYDSIILFVIVLYNSIIVFVLVIQVLLYDSIIVFVLVFYDTFFDSAGFAFHCRALVGGFQRTKVASTEVVNSFSLHGNTNHAQWNKFAQLRS